MLIDGILVNGRKLTANLDTGSDGYFQLTPAAVIALGLAAEARQAPVSKSMGFNGDTENRQGKLKQVTIGGIAIDGPPVIFYGPGTGRDHEAWGLRIGNDFLKNYILTMDYRRKRITLQNGAGP